MKKNIFIYISSFIFAILLWMYINLNLSYNVTISVPINVNLEKSQALASELPEKIEITVKGKGWELIGIMLSRNIAINLDLTTFKKDSKINLGQTLNEYLTLPGNISVVSVSPNYLDISFDNISTKMVKVKNNIIVNPKNGYSIIGNAKLSSDSVKITGAMSIIGKIKFLPTETIIFNDVNSDLNKTVKIIDTLTNVMKIDPKNITVSYIIELSAEKSIEDLQIVVTNVPADKEVLIVPPKMKIYLRGGVDELSKITPSDIIVSIDYKQIESDSSGSITPKIILPSEMNIIRHEPQIFQYIIKKKNIEKVD